MARAALTAAALGVLAVALGDVSSGLAHARGASTEAGRCTKAEATAVVRRLRLGDPFATLPVFKVLCGSFAGPGSQTMVASLLGEANTGMIGWAVFRLAGGEWQLLMERRGAATLTASGSDIKESVSIYRANDPRCCPSGGEKSRVWRWNGSRFVAARWQLPGSGAQEQPARFTSPSGNIDCWMWDGSRSDLGPPAVGCLSWQPPNARVVKLNAAGRLEISRNRFQPEARRPSPLAYGRQITVGRFRCQSLQIGVRCIVIKSGTGFLINREGVKRVDA